MAITVGTIGFDFSLFCFMTRPRESGNPRDAIVQHQKCMAKATENEEANDHHATDFLHLRWCRNWQTYVRSYLPIDGQKYKTLQLFSGNEQVSAFFSDQSSLPRVLWFFDLWTTKSCTVFSCSHDQQGRRTTTDLHRLTNICEFWVTLRGESITSQNYLGDNLVINWWALYRQSGQPGQWIYDRKFWPTGEGLSTIYHSKMEKFHW